ncbi:MAG: hypothetical protein ACRDNE_12305 [Gaiellaceae bacterium]
MERLRPAWLLGLPLLAVGWLSAHALAYELVPVEEHGHGYLAQAPLFLTLCAATLGVALASRIAGRRGRGLPRWLAGALPLVGFAVQEHLERGLAVGAVPWGTALEPVFLLGLVLQLPFAVAALLVARALTALADAVAARPAARPRFPLRVAPARPAPAELAAAPVLARGWAGRAPPVRT